MLAMLEGVHLFFVFKESLSMNGRTHALLFSQFNGKLAREIKPTSHRLFQDLLQVMGMQLSAPGA